jgi:hypothetical protein
MSPLLLDSLIRALRRAVRTHELIKHGKELMLNARKLRIEDAIKNPLTIPKS